MNLHSLHEPAASPAANGFPLLRLGFRPFYLVAALFATIAVPVWTVMLSGKVSVPIPGLWWHAHEMIFGFVAAVVVGFLFTAGRNWTGSPTPTGAPLAMFVMLWLGGRVAMATDSGIAGAVIDLAFLPAAAAVLSRVLRRAKNRRNYFIVGLLALLSIANLAFHFGRFGFLAIDPLAALHSALAVLIVLETVIGGRVIPSFTASALKGVRQWQYRWLDFAAIVCTALGMGAWALAIESTAVIALLTIAAVLQLVRCAGWNPWAARRIPLLWILHLAHLWIPVGLALLAASLVGSLPRSAGVHALTIGATAGLIIGMITRTALGHTGRALTAGRFETTAYALVQAAAVARVSTLVVCASAASVGIRFAATCWTAAFLLYLWRYLPYLVRPRVDGQPG